MNERITTKMVKDDDRTVIVIEGADAERDKAVFRILSTYYGLENAAPQNSEEPQEIPTVKGLEAPPQLDVELPSDTDFAKMTNYTPELFNRGEVISGGKYKGETAAGVLERDKEIALVELFTYARKIPNGNEKGEIVRQCKQFMYNLPDLRSFYSGRARKIQFLNTISKIMTLNPFVTGYPDFRNFCNFATDSEIDQAFTAVTKSLQDRALRNNTVVS